MGGGEGRREGTLVFVVLRQNRKKCVDQYNVDGSWQGKRQSANYSFSHCFYETALTFRAGQTFLLMVG